MGCSSNVQRTLQSAKSFLSGMFPDTAESIELSVSQMKYCTLLHGFRCSSEFKEMQERSLSCDGLSGQLWSWRNDNFYPALADKLWNMTGFEKLNPRNGSMVDRLMQFQPIAQMIRIERAHNIPLLMNPKNIQLETEEVSGVMKVAGHLCRLRY